jgi:ElaB/YqjD/DUF883 family membrane-anchored ribosome-binding protein
MDDKRIGDRVGDAADSLNRGMASAVESGSDLAGKAQSAAAQAGSTIRDAAAETSKQVSDAASKAYAQGTQAADYVSRNTVEQPWVALMLAAAVGYGIAYMIHGR